MVENTFELPSEYSQIEVIDLLGNRRQLLLVNGFCLLIAAVMVFAVPLFYGLQFAFSIDNLWGFVLKLLVFVVAVVIYMVLHELVHGVFIKKFSGQRAKYGFGFGYAYAGSDCYFNKKSYIIIALSPVIFWGAVLVVLNLLVPSGWFWVVYGVQIINVSGAAGDYYVTHRMLRLPEDILVKDSGTKMLVYSKNCI